MELPELNYNCKVKIFSFCQQSAGDGEQRSTSEACLGSSGQWSMHTLLEDPDPKLRHSPVIGLVLVRPTATLKLIL